MSSQTEQAEPDHLTTEDLADGPIGEPRRGKTRGWPVIPTAEEIEAARTPAGGYTRQQLAAWGISWPPPKGWRQQLLAQAERVTHERPGPSGTEQ